MCVMELGHLLTRSGLTYPEVSSNVYHDSFCQLGSRPTTIQTKLIKIKIKTKIKKKIKYKFRKDVFCCYILYNHRHSFLVITLPCINIQSLTNNACICLQIACQLSLFEKHTACDMSRNCEGSMRRLSLVSIKRAVKSHLLFVHYRDTRS